MLVIDTSLVFSALLAGSDGFAWLSGQTPVAPPLLWSEVRSALHEARWRRDLEPEVADRAHRQLDLAPVEPRAPAELGRVAWQIADELGWAKTYDAEFVALARLLGCRLVTSDARLRRGAARLGLVIGPTEL